MMIAVSCANCAAMHKLDTGKVVPQPLRPDLGTGVVKGSDLGAEAVKGMGSDLGTGVVKGMAVGSNVAVRAAMFEPFSGWKRNTSCMQISTQC
jgi:hypothetical protein